MSSLTLDLSTCALIVAIPFIRRCTHDTNANAVGVMEQAPLVPLRIPN